MIATLGKNIKSAFTAGQAVKAIYSYGHKVWGEEPGPGPEPTDMNYYWIKGAEDNVLRIATSDAGVEFSFDKTNWTNDWEEGGGSEITDTFRNIRNKYPENFIIFRAAASMSSLGLAYMEFKGAVKGYFLNEASYCYCGLILPDPVMDYAESGLSVDLVRPDGSLYRTITIKPEHINAFITNPNGLILFNGSGSSNVATSASSYSKVVTCTEPGGEAQNYIDVGSGDKVYFRNTSRSLVKLTVDSPYSVGGNIHSMYNYPEMNSAASMLPPDEYQDYYRGDKNLIRAAELVLPYMTMIPGLYMSMFNGCTSLISAPELPATTLAVACYSSMFNGCTSLTTAPSILPATTLAGNCYSSMFWGCNALTVAPELPATTLISYCYHSMFYGCTQLQIMTVYADTIQDGSITDWLYGVAETGVFYNEGKYSSYTMGPSGIPEGWVTRKKEYTWVDKTWNYRLFAGNRVWKDNDGHIYYSDDDYSQYELVNGDWISKTWNWKPRGGAGVWKDNDGHIYYSSIYYQYELVNGEWVEKTWNYRLFAGNRVWKDNDGHIYFSEGSQYELVDGEWVEKTWNWNPVLGECVWKDNDGHIYYSDESYQYELVNGEWVEKTWNWNIFSGNRVWKDNDGHIYCSDESYQYELVDGEWVEKTWNKEDIIGSLIWKDNDGHIYYSYESYQYELVKA